MMKRHFLFAAVTLVSCVWQLNGSGPVLIEQAKVPDGGIQPQAIVHGDVVHLIYYKGDARAGDIFYRRRLAGENDFGAAVRVNTRTGNAIAAGTIRGAQMSIGKGGRVHVIWNGSDKSDQHAGAPLWYTRMTEAGDVFEPERDLIVDAAGLDGGSSVAADGKGKVYAFWHAHEPGGEAGELGRAVFLRRSSDGGKSFGPETRISIDPGVCACCGLRGFADEDGTVAVLYRSAVKPDERDMQLLLSRHGGQQFKRILKDEWKVGGCPMSSAQMTSAKGGGFWGAWETSGQIYVARVAGGSGGEKVKGPIAIPGKGGGRKHPVMAVDGEGRVLVAWTEGTGWQRGGKVAWELLGEDGKPGGTAGRADGIPVWSFATAFAKPEGGFVVMW